MSNQYDVNQKQAENINVPANDQMESTSKAGSLSVNGSPLNVSIGQDDSSFPPLSATLPLDDSPFNYTGQQSIDIDYNYNNQDGAVPDNAANDAPPSQNIKSNQQQPKPVPQFGNRDGAVGGDDISRSSSVADHESIAPAALRDRAPLPPQVPGEKQSLWKGAFVGAGIGAVAGGTAGGIGGAIMGGGIFSIPLAAAGAIGVAPIGAIIGFGVGMYKAYKHNKALEQAQQQAMNRFHSEQQELNGQKEHFDQAIINLRQDGVNIGAAEINNLNCISSNEWDNLLTLDHVEEKADCLKIRQGIIAHIVDGGDAESASEYKAKLEDAYAKNTLDFMLGAERLADKSPAEIAKFMRDFAHVIGSEELWSAKGKAFLGDAGNGVNVIATTAPYQFGGHMMLNVMRRLQDPNYVLTKDDQRQINQALSPEDIDQNFIEKVITDDQVGHKMTYDQKMQLADRMESVYVNKTNLKHDQVSEMHQTYSLANTLDEKLNTLEHLLEVSTGYTKHSVMRAMRAVAESADLSHMDRAQTKPNPPSQDEQQKKQFIDRFRSGISITVGHDDDAREKLSNEISSMKDEVASEAYNNERRGKADVSRFFMNDNSRMPMVLRDNDNAIDLKETLKRKDAGDENLQDWDAGNQLLQFCNNDAAVAKNLSRFAHQGILRGVMDIVHDNTGIQVHEHKLPALGFSADDSDNHTSFDIEKNANGDFIMTVTDDKGLTSITPPPMGSAPRTVDPQYNRCVSRFKIKFKAEDLRAGNGEFEFVEDPTFDIRMQPDRGNFENTRAAHQARQLNQHNIGLQEQTQGMRNFMAKHRELMLQDKFWQMNVNDRRYAKENEDTFGTGLALSIVQHAAAQETLTADHVRDLKKALNPTGRGGQNAGGVDPAELDALVNRPMDDDTKGRLADLIYRQYVPANQNSGGLFGRPQLNIYPDPLNQVHQVFNNQESTGAEKLEALEATLENVIGHGAAELAPALQSIFENWPDPAVSAM